MHTTSPALLINAPRHDSNSRSVPDFILSVGPESTFPLASITGRVTWRRPLLLRPAVNRRWLRGADNVVDVLDHVPDSACPSSTTAKLRAARGNSQRNRRRARRQSSTRGPERYGSTQDAR